MPLTLHGENQLQFCSWTEITQSNGYCSEILPWNGANGAEVKLIHPWCHWHFMVKINSNFGPENNFHLSMEKPRGYCSEINQSMVPLTLHGSWRKFLNFYDKKRTQLGYLSEISSIHGANSYPWSRSTTISLLHWNYTIQWLLKWNSTMAWCKRCWKSCFSI